ncbi:hypothetical protein LXL04_002657 [Taraxacum kok-saghyz]
MWRAALSRLPTRKNLVKRRVTLNSPMCVWCNRVEETEDHLFFECLTAKELRAHLHSWWGNDGLPVRMVSTSSLFDDEFRTKSPKIEIARRAYMWVLWNYRNEAVFGGKSLNNKQLSAEVKIVAFNWFCSRGKNYGCICWDTWSNSIALYQQFPLYSQMLSIDIASIFFGALQLLPLVDILTLQWKVLGITYDASTHEWLTKIPSSHWSKAHMNWRAKRDGITNNICEVFNSNLIDTRDKLTLQEKYNPDHLKTHAGSVPFVPKGIEVDGKTVVISDHALELEFVPDWIAIVGSGYIGLELSDMDQTASEPPQFPVRPPPPPMQVFGPRVEPLPHGGWFPMGSRQMNRRPVSVPVPLHSESMHIHKKHSLRAPPFVHKVESSLLPKEESSMGQSLSSSRDMEIEGGNNDNFNESPSEYLHYIAFKCGTKVEFRQALTPSVDLQFSVEIWFAGEKIGEGNGRTRREAQHEVAEASLMNIAGNFDADKYLLRSKFGTSYVYGEEGRFPLDGSEKTPRNGEAKSTKLKEYKLPKDDNRPQKRGIEEKLSSNHDVVHPKNHKGPINLRLQDEDEEDYEEHEDYDEEEHEVDFVREENIGSTSHVKYGKK